MTSRQKQAYAKPEVLKDTLKHVFVGKKFRLQCGY